MKTHKKYKLTNSTISVDGRVLHRIVALKDFDTVYGYEVHKGDLGGWIEKRRKSVSGRWLLGF